MPAPRELIYPRTIQVSNPHPTSPSIRSKYLSKKPPSEVIALLYESNVIGANHGCLDPKFVSSVVSWFGANPNDLATPTLLGSDPVHVEIVSFTNPNRAGIYYLGTDFVAISIASLSNDDFARYALCHELNHLASCRVGGINYLLPDSLFDLPFPVWLDEGLNEKITRNMATANLGYSRASKVFSNQFPQMSAIQGIEAIVGAQVLLRSSRSKDVVGIFDTVDAAICYEFSRDLFLGYNYAKDILVERATLK